MKTDTPETEGQTINLRGHLIVSNLFARKLEQERDHARWVIARVIDSLPRNIDWLDPRIEDEMKGIQKDYVQRQLTPPPKS